MRRKLPKIDPRSGRIVEALGSQPSPYKTASYSITGNAKILEGSKPDIVDRNRGVVRLASHDELASDLCEMLSSNQSASVFADTYASAFEATCQFNASQQIRTDTAIRIRRDVCEPVGDNHFSSRQPRREKNVVLETVMAQRYTGSFEIALNHTEALGESHDYIAHNYTGHDCIGHNYTGHNCRPWPCIRRSRLYML